jgi:hypothetical protein
MFALSLRAVTAQLRSGRRGSTESPDVSTSLSSAGSGTVASSFVGFGAGSTENHFGPNGPKAPSRLVVAGKIVHLLEFRGFHLLHEFSARFTILQARHGGNLIEIGARASNPLQPLRGQQADFRFRMLVANSLKYRIGRNKCGKTVGFDYKNIALLTP